MQTKRTTIIIIPERNSSERTQTSAEKIFKAKRNRSEQVANFKTVDCLIKAQVGTEYDAFVLESLEQDSIAGPPEPTLVYLPKVADSNPDVMSEVEKMKFKSKSDKYLTRTDTIEMQLK